MIYYGCRTHVVSTSCALLYPRCQRGRLLHGCGDHEDLVNAVMMIMTCDAVDARGVDGVDVVGSLNRYVRNKTEFLSYEKHRQ